MRRRAAVMGLLALGLSFAQPLVVGSLARADSPYRLADAEAALLHRRLDLKGISQYSRVQKRWQPLTLPSARVYVVNLWGVACAPCRAEFPLLRNIQRAWQGQRDVVFVYLADPPLESLPEQIERYWQDGKDALPDADPARCSDETLRRQLGNDAQPITLLLDGQLVVRQAFIGAIGDRPLGAAIARLLAAVPGNRPATRQNPAPAAR